MTPLLSFIIPAYNAEPYLQECLDSIYRLDAHGAEMEVIVVDDGSTDGTPALLADYQKKYPDLRLLAQENFGQGSARNVGMRLATGKYICFVDADDCLLGAPLPVEILSHQSIDILSVEVCQTDWHGRLTPYRRYIPPYHQLYEPARRFMQGRNLQPCPYAYFFRREFLQKEEITFPDGIYHEDEEFVVRAFAYARTFMALPLNWYNRFLRPESTTTTTNSLKQQRNLRHMVIVLQHLQALADTDVQLRACMQYKMDYLAVDTLRVLLRQHHPKAFRREIVDDLRTLGYFPLRWHSEWKHLLFNLFTRIFL